jgi:outer membrane protein OmpA-like peptidoglycan-associated protein
MKTTLALLLGSLLFASAALADTTPPDFVGGDARPHIDPSLVAQPMQPRPKIQPADIVAFGFNTAGLTEAGFSQVDRAALWLGQHPAYRLVLEGHTDAVGAANYNKDLSMRRIATVRQRLLQDGIGSDRIIMMSYGDVDAIEPANPNDRRVVMYATKMSPKAVVAATFAFRAPIVASWTDQNLLIQQGPGVTAPTAISRR